MAIYHLHCQIIGRSSGRSAIAAAAYRAGENLTDEETGIVSDYTRKGGVIYSEIQLCANAPEEYADRSTLWNAVSEVEKSKDAQLAREIEVALPRELDEKDWRQMIRNYCQDNFVSRGMIADWSIHHPDKADDNPHCHIMLTTRPIKEDGTWDAKEKKVYARDEYGDRIPVIDPSTGEQKVGARGRKMWVRETVQTNDWNSRDNIASWREAWADECNRWIDAHNDRYDQSIERIDHRSYADRSIDKIPGVHVGVAANEMAARQIENNDEVTADRYNVQQDINAANQEWHRNQIDQGDILRQLSETISEAMQRAQEAQETLLQKIQEKIEAAKQAMESLAEKVRAYFGAENEKSKYEKVKQDYYATYDRLVSIDQMQGDIDRYRRLTDQINDVVARDDMSPDDVRKWEVDRQDVVMKIRAEYAEYSGKEVIGVDPQDIQLDLNNDREALVKTLKQDKQAMDVMLDHDPILDVASAQYRRSQEHDAPQSIIEDAPNYKLSL